MSTQDDDNNLQNMPTPETHGPGSNARGHRDQSGELEDDEPSNSLSEPDDTSEPAEPTETADDASSDSSTSRLSKIDRVHGALEAILLASDGPISRARLLETFDDAAPSIVDQALNRIELEFSGRARGIHLEHVAGGYELRSNPDYDDQVRALVEASPVNLSRAALETLAIIAYRQPITRTDIEDIRGVDSSGVLRTLQDLALVQVVGRLDDLGRPHVYGTTDRFLEIFGLDDLTELPTLSEDEHQSLEELYEDEMESFDDEFE